MQKLIIVRGHSGSGKSTFAKQKIVEFCATYSCAEIFHIENDHYLIEEGKYYWTSERFKQAKQIAQQKLQQALQFCQQFPSKNLLIIVSNVGVNTQEIKRLLKQAQALGMTREVYRLQNFFHNQHQVAQETIYSMYLSLIENSIEDEILVTPIMPMTEKIRDEIERFKLLKRKNTAL